MTDTLTIEIPERFDYHTVPAFMQNIQGQVGQCDTLICLDQLQKMDSAGVAVLIDLIRQAKQGQQSIRFSSAPPNIKKLFDLYGVAGLFEKAVEQK